MAVYRTVALILRHAPEREHDRYLIAISPERGQLRLRARGTKKSASKLAGSLEPLTEAELLIADGRAIDQVIGAVTRRRFTVLRQHLFSLVAAQWYLELVERMTKPEQDLRALYDLVLRDLAAMEAEAGAPVGQHWLQLCGRALRLLEHEGFAPALGQCSVCHRPLETDQTSYHPHQGFVHRTETAPDAVAITPATMAFLLSGQATSDRRVLAEVHRLVESVIHHTFDRPLKSEPVLRDVMRATIRREPAVVR